MSNDELNERLSSACPRSCSKSSLILDADGEAHRSASDERSGSLLGCVFLAASSCGGITSDSVEPKLAAMAEQSKRFGEAVALFESGVQFEAHHGPEVAHLPLRQGVLRVGLESRIMHALAPAVTLQESAHRQRIRALPLVAQEIRRIPR